MEAAIEDIRQNYAGLYGVEELSERLGVSKSHLVRTFTAAVGVPPGRYLTTVRVEAAMRLLLHREYTLDVIASLCGFSGANYLCRVFKKETGQSPAQWRALAGQTARPSARRKAAGAGTVYLKCSGAGAAPGSFPQRCSAAHRLRALEQEHRQGQRDGLGGGEGRPHAVHAEQGAQDQ